MNRLSSFVLALGLVAASTGQGRTASATAAAPPAAPGATKGSPSPSSGFAFELFQQARTTNKNVLVGTSSLYSVLSMTALGATANTRSEMARVLRTDGEPQKIVSAAREDARALQATVRGGAELRTSNRLFVASGFPLLASFARDAEAGFDAKPQTLDFATSLDAARTTINQLVSADTRRKIPELLPQGTLSTTTRLVLTNAVYFKAAWDTPFVKSQTRSSAFYTPSGSGSASSVPTMHGMQRLVAAVFPGGKMVEIPYRDTDLVMDVILPDDRAGLDAQATKLDAGTFATLVSTLSPRDVTISLPKFSYAWGSSVVPALTRMGMKSAFSGSTGFAGISTREGLKVDDVVQKTFIGVDEAGTEAAAASAVEMSNPSAMMPAPAPAFDFTADHPFLFVLRAGSRVLFVGQVASPKGE